MAMFTTAPGRKLAYNLDGTVVSWYATGVSTTILSQASLNNLNDEEFTSDSAFTAMFTGNYTCTVLILFPEKRDITNYFIYAGTSNASRTVDLTSVSVSTDSTDGSNGTWTTLANPSPIGILSYGNTENYTLSSTEWFDNSYVSGTLSGATAIKAIKFDFNGYLNYDYLYFKTLNLYGNINDSSATRRLAWTDSSGTELTNDLTYTGQRSSSNVSSLYLKNLYTSATSQIVFSIDGECTTVNSNVTISVDGGTTYNALPFTWTTTLAASTVSSEIKVKYDVSASETYGYKYFNIQALPTYV